MSVLHGFHHSSPTGKNVIPAMLGEDPNLSEVIITNREGISKFSFRTILKLKDEDIATRKILCAEAVASFATQMLQQLRLPALG